MRHIPCAYLLSYIRSKFFSTPPWSEERFIFRTGCTCRRLAEFAYLCDDAGRVSRRAGRRAGYPRVRVEACGRGGGRNKRKGSPRVEKMAVEDGERSFFSSFNDTILPFKRILKI